MLARSRFTDFLHRARYGWAPCDVWNLDAYLSRVMAGCLKHLADENISWPGEGSEWTTPAEWEAELRHHADVLESYLRGKFTAEDATLHKDVATTLARLGVIWGHLWD